MIWDIYDGPRSGIATFQGEPHYFWCDFENVQYGHEVFKLAPIAPDLLAIATENWAIYRAWELKFHSGLVESASHPGHGGIDQRYDELNERIETALTT